MTRSQTAEYWKNKMEEHRASGLSYNAFCRQEKLAYSTFYSWRIKLQKGFESRFREIKEEEKPKNGQLRLACGDIELRIDQGLDPRELSRLIQALHLASQIT